MFQILSNTLDVLHGTERINVYVEVYSPMSIGEFKERNLNEKNLTTFVLLFPLRKFISLEIQNFLQKNFDLR